jgi:endo-1,4-beta-xylanase
MKTQLSFLIHVHLLTVACCMTLGPLKTQGQLTTAEALSPERIAQRIETHRTTLATVIVMDSEGRRLANRPVTVEQTAHQFLFGCNAFQLNPADPSPEQLAYQNQFAALWNFATLPFYWGSYERTRGEPEAARLRAMAEWCQARGLVAKGHPLCWHQVTPRWAATLSTDEIERLQLERIRREVTAFAGLVDTWDVVNEAVIMPRFEQDRNPISAWSQQVGRLPLIQMTFDAARRANPQAALILNDYLTTEEYEGLIEETLSAGVQLEAIGIQSHMHNGYRGAAWAWETSQRFARFNQPLHFTETTIISGRVRDDVRWHGPRHDDWHTTPDGESLQADQVEEFYRVLFSHPAVEAITWWDFTDHAWLGAPAGFLRKDMSPKPAYDRLFALVQGEWWTARQPLQTDDHGQIRFRGFLGRYSLTHRDVGASFALARPGKTTVYVALPPFRIAVENVGLAASDDSCTEDSAESDPAPEVVEEDVDTLRKKVALAMPEISEEVRLNLGLAPNTDWAQVDHRVRREETRRVFARRGLAQGIAAREARWVGRAEGLSLKMSLEESLAVMGTPYEAWAITEKRGDENRFAAIPLDSIAAYKHRQLILYYSPYDPPDSPSDQLMNPRGLLWGQFPYQDVVLWFGQDGLLSNCSIWH